MKHTLFIITLVILLFNCTSLIAGEKFDSLQPAIEAKKNLILYFSGNKDCKLSNSFNSLIKNDKECKDALKPFNRLRVYHDSCKELEPLYKDVLFDSPGLVLLDCSTQPINIKAILPFKQGKYSKVARVSPKSVLMFLNSPADSLTRNTLIYAIRTHDENPQSTDSVPSEVLMDAATKHAEYQATILVQGHQYWDYRASQIRKSLPSVSPTEVCAESWSNLSLIDAAEDCVHSWRQSSGHWRAVKSKSKMFGYDIQRGRNRIWYATGILAE
jgi:hypothetical protein